MKDTSMTSRQNSLVFLQEASSTFHKCGTKQLSSHKNPYVDRRSGKMIQGSSYKLEYFSYSNINEIVSDSFASIFQYCM